MTTIDFVTGFFGKHPFGKDTIKQLQEKWSKMTDGEKLEFMNARFANMGEERFSVDKIEAFCEQWWQMSPKEKQAFVDERKKAFDNRICSMHGF